jgi:outer membrane lipoprotein SlyB
MSKKTVGSAAIAVLALGLGGCAQYTGWTPTVDSYNDPNAQYLSRDMQDCKYLAEHASGGGATQAAMGTAIGGLVGAAAGAAIGAAVGAPGTGAAIGAAAGGIGTGAYKGTSSEDDYKTSYIRCMKNRGHNVVNY